MKFHDAYLEIAAPSHRLFGEALGKQLREGTQRDVVALLATSDVKEKRALSEPYLVAARHFAPQFVEELEGYAKGAEVAFEHLWLLSLEDELDDADHCTTVVSKDGRYIAHNEDWDIPNSADRVWVLRRRIGSNETLDIYYRNTLGGNAISVNNHGLVQAVNSLRKMDVRIGVPHNVVARAAADACDAREAEELITTAERASGLSHVLVDDEGVACVESSATKHAILRPKSAFCHTNHVLDPELEAIQIGTASENSLARLAAAEALVHGTFSRKHVIEGMADQSQGPKNSLLNKDTIGRVFVDREKKTFDVWLRKEDKACWVSYPFPA